jgi:uncharacterized tellurite resistance protein B-like protein
MATFDDKAKRAFIALACKVAWADGVVQDEERAQVTALLKRLGSPVSESELDEWLKSGAPPAELSELPPALSEMFIYEAWKLIEADGDVTDQEIKLIEGLLARVAKVHENAGTGTKVAQIAIVKKPWRP